MELKLSAEEQEFLLNVLEQRRQELLAEISHTDRREFKQGLCSDENLLESLLSRLQVSEVQEVRG